MTKNSMVGSVIASVLVQLKGHFDTVRESHRPSSPSEALRPFYSSLENEEAGNPSLLNSVAST